MLTGTKIVGSNPKRGRVVNDFYTTPLESIEALLSVELFDGEIWECACGNGAISKVLEKNGYQVKSSDLIYRGYGQVSSVDFLESNYKTCNIVTNPPFSLALEFAEQSLKLASKKVALFCKIQFLEGQKRGRFFNSNNPNRVYVFSKRQNPVRNGELQWANLSSVMCFAWFVWDKTKEKKDTVLKWI